MTDRRPLGTGPATPDVSHLRDTDPPAPRAQLAAERLRSVPAAEPKSTRPAAGRRTLGAGPAAPDGDTAL
ncbi:hypothetical protein ABT298_25590 [Streptomyces sp. NPDC001034]|uniref:hypothetical protein n=1 Tax=Streptomyces sp. NPDC001034 TaxID=3154375 RepID=UPI00331ABF6B